MLMSLTEAIIFSILCLCRCQKLLFSLFRAYVVDRSDYFLHFVLMSLAGAIIFFISCLCRWQKHWENSFFALLNGAVAWNSSCCFLQTKNIVSKFYFWSLRIG